MGDCSLLVVNGLEIELIHRLATCRLHELQNEIWCGCPLTRENVMSSSPFLCVPAHFLLYLEHCWAHACRAYRRLFPIPVPSSKSAHVEWCSHPALKLWPSPPHSLSIPHGVGSFHCLSLPVNSVYLLVSIVKYIVFAALFCCSFTSSDEGLVVLSLLDCTVA